MTATPKYPWIRVSRGVYAYAADASDTATPEGKAKRRLMGFVDLIDQTWGGMIGPATAFAHTGEPYVTLALGGIKAEGEDHPVLLSTPMKAVARFEKVLTAYIHTRFVELGGTLGHPLIFPSRIPRLIWRRQPMLEGRREKGVETWSVSARLIYSNTPERLWGLPGEVAYARAHGESYGFANGV